MTQKLKREWYHTMFLLEEGVFIQPYSISYGNGEHRVDFFIDTMFLPEGGFFFPALLYIGTSLVSYNVSA